MRVPLVFGLFALTAAQCHPQLTLLEVPPTVWAGHAFTITIQGAAAPGSAGAERSPGSLHAKVRMDGDIGRDPNQQVLAPRRDLIDRSPGQIRRGVSRHPEVGPRQQPARKRLPQPPGGQKDRVALGHQAMVSDGTEAPVLRLRHRQPGRRGDQPDARVEQGVPCLRR